MLVGSELWFVSPPFGWGGNVLLFPPIMGGQYIIPPFFETLGGKFFVPPHRDFRGGEIFSWGETPNGGKKASMVRGTEPGDLQSQ